MYLIVFLGKLANCRIGEKNEDVSKIIKNLLKTLKNINIHFKLKMLSKTRKCMSFLQKTYFELF